MSSLSNADLHHELGKGIVIHPMRLESVTPVGYDLSVGLAVGLSSSVSSSMTESGFLIPASTSALVISKESVWLSGGILATLHSRGSYSARGLIINSTTVDPNWSGQMTFLIHNSSKQDFVVRKDDPFVTMVMHYVRTPTKDEPAGNPISVVQRYADIYGSDVGNAVNTYLNSSENLAERRQHDYLVREARGATLLSKVAGHIKSGLSLATSFRGMCLLALWGLLFGVIAMPRYWAGIAPFLHGIAYDSKVFAGQVGAMVAIVALIIQLSKK